jgi:hypothetical protein
VLTSDGVAIIAIPSLLKGTAAFAYRELGLFVINLIAYTYRRF